ncbi:MAG TPA: alpha/beta hydrolase [Roseiarcus sp.]|nr:alpha/beta hydrolase [Roseiarcus sp.]
MGLDPRARRFLDFVVAGARGRTGALDLSDLRQASVGLAAFAGRAPEVERRDEFLPGYAPALALRHYTPRGRSDAALPALVYFHGGGWISGGLDTHDALCATLAHRGECRVIAVDYRLAPEHRFPAAIEDGAAALSAIGADPRRFGVDPRRLAIGGDSAGANLAVVVARAPGAPLALQVLLCPVMEPLGRTRSREELANGYLIEEATMARYWEHYGVEGLAPTDPRVAPLRARDFAGLPPALIHVAEFDPLRDEGELYAEALAHAGIRVKLTRHAGLIHHFYGLGGVIPAAQAALERIGDDVREAFAEIAG